MKVVQKQSIRSMENGWSKPTGNKTGVGIQMSEEES